MAEHGFEYVKEIGKCIVTDVLWPPFKRQVDYWLCCPENIQGLTDETRLLKRAKLDVDQKKEEARYRAESVAPDVEIWSNKATQKLEVSERISQRYNELKPWDIFPWYSLGKSAKRTAQGILKLRNEADSMMISFPAPPASMRSISHEPTEKLESRRRVEENIVESLIDDRIRMIAICGPGGVGKTTMVQRIEERVRKERLFDEVVSVDVGQRIDIPNIQKEIAEILGLKLGDDTLPGRAHKLHTRLLGRTRKLLIFDNVWKSFNLKHIGVPFGNGFEACKIILTSRSRDVCEDMDAQKVVQIDVLDEEEAWRLFREKSGECVDKPELRPIAKAVAAKCSGLPIAIVTIGKALKNRRIETWSDSLSQLKRANPTNFPEVKNVYEMLKLSYDLLETESEKSLFLLCCLFPDGYSIPIELLTLCSIGLGMLEGIKNIEEGRCRTHHLVERLKSLFLLMNGGREHDVKMHDVIRDVAIYIGLKERRGFLKSMEASSMPSSSQDSSRNCNWMSIDITKENAKLPTWSDFPNLSLLMMLNSTDSKFPQGFDLNFEGMEELNVLYFSRINLPSLPTNLVLLKKLTMLHLGGCAMKDISILAELASLIILRIHDCGNIEELPADIGRLNRLRLLELITCKRLARIVAGVISSLVGLEELTIIDSFDRWEAKDGQNKENNARLCELESLPNLTSLHIDICKWNMVAEELRLSQQLVRYSIRSTMTLRNERERSISLVLPGDVKVGNWILQLARSTQSLFLDGNGSHNFNFAKTESLKTLLLTSCSTMKKLANGIDCKFHELEELSLLNLEELEEITDGTIPEGSKSFQQLRRLFVYELSNLTYLWKSPSQNISLGNVYAIYVYRCPNLRYLFSLATARSLVQLSFLDIQSCDKIEQVFQNEIENNMGDSIIVFPKLRLLQLQDLQNLVAFSQGTEIKEFPQLERLEIVKCPKFRTETCKWNIRLGNLGTSRLNMLEEILPHEMEGNRSIIFPELRLLELIDLTCLTASLNRFESIEFPRLERLIIGGPKSLAPVDSKSTLAEHSLHLFCNKKFEFPGLKKPILTHTREDVSKIWGRHIPVNILSNIWYLSISEMDDIKCLMSPSIAKNLVNLGRLFIKRCQGMVEVIEDEKEVNITSLFPNLIRITIRDLRKLRSFCQLKHAFELPSLSDVIISDCPGLETFSVGSPSTPKLSWFWVNKERVEKKDLNGGISNHFMTKSQSLGKGRGHGIL